jgi:hypothetical protein
MIHSSVPSGSEEQSWEEKETAGSIWVMRAYKKQSYCWADMTSKLENYRQTTMKNVNAETISAICNPAVRPESARGGASINGRSKRLSSFPKKKLR